MVLFKEIYLLNSIHFIYFLIFISIYFHNLFSYVNISYISNEEKIIIGLSKYYYKSIEFYSVHPDLYPFVNSWN